MGPCSTIVQAIARKAAAHGQRPMRAEAKVGPNLEWAQFRMGPTTMVRGDRDRASPPISPNKRVGRRREAEADQAGRPQPQQGGVGGGAAPTGESGWRGHGE
jgi:hypothetical protein